MKVIFAVSAAVLIGVAILAVATLPEQRSDVPVLWWTTDANKARGPQVAGFEQWMLENGYGGVDLRIDGNNTGTMKIIIQSASGECSEIVNIYGGHQLRELVAAGVLLDVTDLAKEYGFGPDKTYASVRQEIMIDNRQYSFPCSLGEDLIMFNRALLEREGLPIPKFDWTWDEFLEWCLKVRKVDKDGNVTRYAVMSFWGPYRLWATNGGSMLNETMTRCVIDSPQNIEASRFYYDLMFKYRVMPTEVDVKAVAAQSGSVGSSGLQWLGMELVVADPVGRWGLIQLREFKNFTPDAALYPHKVIPIGPSYSRSAAVTRRAKNPRLAARFLQYLASKRYNRIIIDCADNLPPCPEAAKDPEFLDPSAHPGEEHVHKKYYLFAKNYSAGREYSKYLNPNTFWRIYRKYKEGFDCGKLGVEEGLRKMTDEVNMEMRHTVERDTKLQRLYEQDCALQARIDALKAEGKPVPLEWIANPVIRHFREAGI